MPDAGPLSPAVDSSIAEWLLREGKLTAAGLDRARRLQAESLERLEFVLTKLGLVSDRDLAQAMAAHLGVAVMTAKEFPEKPLFNDRLKRSFLQHARAIPVADTDAGVIVGMVDPLDPYIAKAIGFALERPVLPRVVLPADFEAAFERLYAAGKTAMGEISDRTADRVDGDITDDAARLQEMASEAPVIRLVNLLITRAVESRASDIHIEPAEGRLRVRYRIDGVLQEVESPPPRLKSAIVSRVKIMAKLNDKSTLTPISERSILLKQKHLMLRSARSARLEAWATSKSFFHNGGR